MPKIKVEVNVQDIIDRMGWYEFAKEAELELWLRAERWESLKMRVGVSINGNIDEMYDIDLLEIVEDEIKSIEIDKYDQVKVDEYLDAMQIIRTQIIRIENLPKAS